MLMRQVVCKNEQSAETKCETLSEDRPGLETGSLALMLLASIAPFALLARWHEAFGILGVCGLLTGLFYGWIWLLERRAIRLLQERYGHLDIYPKDHLPRGWHSIVKDFEMHVLLSIWVVGTLLFFVKFISDLDRR